MSLSEKALHDIQDVLKDADFLDEYPKTDVFGEKLLREEVLNLLSNIITNASDEPDNSTPRYYAKIAAMVIAGDIGIIIHGQPNTYAPDAFKFYIGSPFSKDNQLQTVAIYVHQSFSEDLHKIDESSWVQPQIDRTLSACGSAISVLKSTGRFVEYNKINPGMNI